MKTILVLCTAMLAVAVAWLVVARPFADHYGNPFQGSALVELAQLLDKPADYLKKEVRIEGSVARQCPHCGCWMVVTDAGGRELRVELGESGGPVPFRLGKKVAVEGQLIRFGEGYEFVGSALEFH